MINNNNLIIWFVTILIKVCTYLDNWAYLTYNVYELFCLKWILEYIQEVYVAEIYVFFYQTSI